MKKILIIGATSAIAQATARIWAAEGHRLYVIARNHERLQAIAADLKIRGAESTHYGILDVNNLGRHQAAIDAAIAAMEGIDIVLIAHGTLGDQKACEQDFNEALKELTTNTLSVISLLTHLANRFEAQKRGTIAVISSVAGDRGRQSNYVYGTAKAAVSTFCEGLRMRMFKVGVHVMTIKPGFVDTPMTQDLSLPVLLVAQPEQVACSIVAGCARKANTLYVPGFWALIMFIIRAIPQSVFKKLSL